MSWLDETPFGFFWANRVTGPCPSCGNRTSTGFDRHDPDAGRREPSKCAGCAADVISNSVRMDLTADGYPRYEQGPCVSCQEPTRRYGPHGRPACERCAPGADHPWPTPVLLAAVVDGPPERAPESGQAELFAEAS